MNCFDELAAEVRKAGQYAKQQQKRIHRMIKPDGSILTESDLAVTDSIIGAIKRIFISDYNIVTEEIDIKGFNPKARYTFVLDPIDGTDSYSQGFPAWCIALGILDSARRPVGAMICAPRFGIGEEELFVRTDPGSDEIMIGSKHFQPYDGKDDIRELMIGSNTFREADISSYQGKIRSYGSSIIHMLAPAIYSNIGGGVNPTCYVWDIAASHAVLLKAGMDVCYADGSPFSYTDRILLERQKYDMPLLVGTVKGREFLRNTIKIRQARSGSSS